MYPLAKWKRGAYNKAIMKNGHGDPPVRIQRKGVRTMSNQIKKVVLAYSGGLDTSIIIPWLKENYDNCEVIAVAADVGQGKELSGLEEKAKKTGASKLYIEDLRKVFV